MSDDPSSGDENGTHCSANDALDDGSDDTPLCLCGGSSHQSLSALAGGVVATLLVWLIPYPPPQMVWPMRIVGAFCAVLGGLCAARTAPNLAARGWGKLTLGLAIGVVVMLVSLYETLYHFPIGITYTLFVLLFTGALFFLFGLIAGLAGYQL